MDIFPDETSSALIEQITLYTTQLEEYDRLSAIYMLICVGWAILIFGIIAVLLVREPKKELNLEKSLDTRSGAIAFLSLTIPMITVLYMYVFSMQCRKVAIYRGYLAYLEQQLSQYINTPLCFDDKVVNEFMVGKIYPFSSVNFYTNGFGPFIMQLFIILIYSAACILAGIFMLKFCKSILNKKNQILLKFFWGAVIAISTISLIPFVFDLVHNSDVMQSVYEYCLDIAQNN